MKRLLRFEFRKLFQARVLYICAAVLILVILLFAGINKMEEVVMEEAFSDYSIGEESIDFNTSDEMPEGLASIMGMSTGHSGAADLLNVLTNIYIVVVFAAFIAVFFCGDFGNGTVKNVITKGYTRSEIFFSKYFVCLAVSICYALLAMLTGFLFGTLVWKFGDEWCLKLFLLVLLQLLAIAAYNAMFCFLASWLKRVGPTLAISIALPITVPLILTLIDLFLGGAEVPVSSYWLSGAISLTSSVNATGGDMLRSAVCSLLYGTLFTFGGWFFMRKREV